MTFLVETMSFVVRSGCRIVIMNYCTDMTRVYICIMYNIHVYIFIKHIFQIKITTNTNRITKIKTTDNKYSFKHLNLILCYYF